MNKRSITILVASLALLGACGDDGSSDTTVPASSSTTTTAPSNLVPISQVIAADSRFSTLVSALDAADLTTLLGEPTHYTLFAPTNTAFAALDEGLLDKLLLPANKEVLVKILSYHVLEGDILERDFSAGVLSTLEGTDLQVQHTPTVLVDGATVSATDIRASNGVVHEIDKVLVPATVDLASL